MYEIFESLMKENGVTAYKVSKETGIATSTLSDWKKGRSTPKQDKLQKIADYFNVSLDYLVGNSKAKNIESENKIDEYMDKNKIFFSKFEKLTDKDKDKLIKIIEMFESETQD